MRYLASRSRRLIPDRNLISAIDHDDSKGAFRDSSFNPRPATIVKIDGAGFGVESTFVPPVFQGIIVWEVVVSRETGHVKYRTAERLTMQIGLKTPCSSLSPLGWPLLIAT